MSLAIESCAERLEELYPGLLGTTLIRLRQRDKRPLDSGWNVQAIENYTNKIDPRPVISAMAEHVDSGGNIGWAVPPGVLVLDADSAESAAWLAETFPDSPRQRTADGCHVVVLAPRGVDLNQDTKLEIVPGVLVDLRTSGKGQIAVEPSIHPSGAEYVWEIELDFSSLEELPAVLVERLREREKRKNVHEINEAVWREGTRESRLVSMAGRLRNISLSEAEIRDTLESLNRERCEPPLSAKDIARISRSASKWDRGQDPTEGDAKEARRDAYDLVPFADMRPSFGTEYLVKGLLDRGSMAVMYGQSGSSKSFCALELSVSVASGQKWRGQRVRRGKVAYVAAEGARGIQNRLVAMRNRLALGNIEEIDFYLVSRPVSLVDGSSEVPVFVDSVRSQVGEGIDLVVIDTLSRSLAGKDENSAADMTGAIAQADSLRQELGCAVLIVHHSGKNEALGARGHSSLRAALETELEVKKVGDAYCLTATKQREHEDGTAWWHELEVIELGQDAEGDPVTTCLIRQIEHPGEIESRSKVGLNEYEERTYNAILVLVGGEADSAIKNREAVPKADLRDWVETKCGVPTELRRGVVNKGLKGLKQKGIADYEGQQVFLLKKHDGS